MKKTIFFFVVLLAILMTTTKIGLAKDQQWQSVASTKITKGLIAEQPVISLAAPLKSEKKMIQLFDNILLSTGLEIKIANVIPQANQANSSIDYTFLVWYQETRKQRTEVEKKVKELLPGILKIAKTPLKKELAINNFLCRTVFYPGFPPKHNEATPRNA